MKLKTAQRLVIQAMFGGCCAYCGCELLKGWHADHVEPVQREWWLRGRYAKWVRDGSIGIAPPKPGMAYPERDCIENMFPACRPCNIDKGALPLEVWRTAMEQRVDVCRRNYSAFRHAERFGLVKQVETKVVFYFERYAA